MADTADIPFTQYLMPDGRKKSVCITRPAEIARLAEKLVAQGARLEIEVLTTGEASATVEMDDDKGETQVLAHEICRNGPEVPAAIDRLITDAAEARGEDNG